MPDDGLLLVFCNIIGTHSRKKIIRMIVRTHVVEAELPIFPFAQPPFGRAMRRGSLALRPLAGRALSAQPTILVGLHPDSIEQWRVAVFHDRSVCAQRPITFKA